VVVEVVRVEVVEQLKCYAGLTRDTERELMRWMSRRQYCKEMRHLMLTYCWSQMDRMAS